MKVCYIVGAGEFSGGFVPTEDDLVIAADGGYDLLTNHGIRCDLLVGDLDSLKDIPNGVQIIRHKVEKDETDMHLCFLEGARRGYDFFRIYGGTGGRDDHTFANYCLLSYIRNHGGRAELFSKYAKAYVIKNESVTIRGKEGKTVSVFAFGSDAVGVSIEGLYYEAKDVTLTSDFPLGVSNHFTDKDAKISVSDGTLLIIEER